MFQFLKNPFRRPVKVRTLEKWSTFFMNTANASFVAIPVIAYSDQSVILKVIHILALSALCYGFLGMSRMFDELSEQGDLP